VVQLNKETKRLEKKFQFQHQYPPTKIMWIPEPAGNTPDLMVTSGEILRVWSIENNEKAELKCKLTGNKKELTAPLTSFDWSSHSLNTVITCSIDTTCSIWDINKESLIKTLIAHDKEVLDVSYSPEPQIFATVGADGSVRHFDTRDLSKSDILYEMSECLVRVAWNKNNKHFVAVISMQDSSVTLLDTRKQSHPVSKLNFHKGPVNHLAWAPNSA
jgi:WD repeat-containing protein 68